MRSPQTRHGVRRVFGLQSQSWSGMEVLGFRSTERRLSRTILAVMIEEPVREVVSGAVRRLENELDELSPFMTARVRAWMRRLARDRDPASYFVHLRAFPFVLLPWWFERAARGTVDLELQGTLAGSSISGYYFIRILDGLMDAHAEDELEFLPVLGVFHDRFQLPYLSLFPAGHPFHDRFAATWSACLDATARDAALDAQARKVDPAFDGLARTLGADVCLVSPVPGG